MTTRFIPPLPESSLDVVLFGDLVFDKVTHLCKSGIQDAYRNSEHEIVNETSSAGGAGNVAANLVRLGMNIVFSTSISRERRNEYVDFTHCLAPKGYVHGSYWEGRHATKHRFYDGNKLLMTMSWAARHPVPDPPAQNDDAFADELIGSCLRVNRQPIVVVADYDKGHMNRAVWKKFSTAIINCDRESAPTPIVLTNPRRLSAKEPIHYASGGIVKMSQKEAVDSVGYGSSRELVKNLRAMLLETTPDVFMPRYVWLTLGSEGAVAMRLSADESLPSIIEIPVLMRPSYQEDDPIGCGDAALAIMAYLLRTKGMPQSDGEFRKMAMIAGTTSIHTRIGEYTMNAIDVHQVRNAEERHWKRT